MVDYHRKDTNLSRWRDLDVSQMADWPDVPRRWVLALCACLVMAFAAWLWVLPQYIAWKQATAQTSALQTQYELLAKQEALGERETAALKLRGLYEISPKELPAWISDFAQAQTDQGLKEVNIQPFYEKTVGATSVAARATGNANASSDPDISVGHSSSFIPMTDDPHVGQLKAGARGSYADLLKWAVLLSQREEVLGVDSLEMQGMGAGQLKWQARVFFAQEVKP